MQYRTKFEQVLAEFGIAQAEVAAGVRRSVPLISALVCGTRTPGLRTAQRIGRFLRKKTGNLDLATDYLFPPPEDGVADDADA